VPFSIRLERRWGVAGRRAEGKTFNRAAAAINSHTWSKVQRRAARRTLSVLAKPSALGFTGECRRLELVEPVLAPESFDK
jgi:hypothetical protein